MLNDFSGVYEAFDSRGSMDLPFASLSVSFSGAGRGVAISYSAAGKRLSEYMLFNCGVANQAQAENFGSPVESVLNIIRCDIYENNYQYAHMYIARVGGNYSVRDAALIPMFKPMDIFHGYVIEIKTSPGSGAYIDVKRMPRS